MVQDIDTVTMEDWLEIMYRLSYGTTTNDHE